MKQILYIILFATTVLYANPHTIDLTPKELKYIEQNPIIKAHNEKNWPPFNFEYEGIAKGYSIDYMNLLASKVGLKVEYVQGHAWAQYMQMLQTPNLDLIINISKSEERAKTINFTDVYLSVKNAIYVNINNQDFYSVEDLQGKTIVMPKDFFAQKFIEKNYPEIKQVLVSDQLQALKYLSLGKADATIGKKIVLDYLIQHNMISNVLATQYIEDDELISHMRIGASKEDTILINILTKAQKHVTNEEKNNLSFKWFGAKMKNNEVTNIDLNAQEKTYLRTKKVITMCVDPDWMPFEKIENGKHIGFTSELIAKISQKIDTPINLKITKSWSESLIKAKNKECDMLPMASVTPKRQKYLDFTTPYLTSPLVVAAKTNEIYINGLEKHLDKKYAVVKEYSLEETLKTRYPGIKLVTVNSLNEGLQKVQDGEVFGYLDNAMTIMYEIQKNFLGTISIVGRSTEKIEYRIASRNDDEILHDILQKAVFSISSSEIEEIKNNWSQFKHAILIDYSLVWKIGLASLVTICLLMMFLRKQNMLKKEIEVLNKKLKLEIKKEVTKSREKDQTIFQQAKLVNMGEMIGNISHQWRQPLSEINSIVMKIESDFISNKLDSDALDTNLTKIEDLTEYMSDTIESFNNFFKIDKKTKNFLVSDCINQVIYLFESSFQKNQIGIELKILNDDNVDSFEGEFLQVLIIILQNAKDVLLINKVSDAKILITIDREENRSIIKISDNAGGVPENIIDKIFEPYFTTKFKSKGIGIGLYMAKMIIEKNMNGILKVNNINNGAEFKIELPLKV
jgi:polar amino acid transport system substrate-binding protein